MRKMLAVALASSVLMLGGVACDDNEAAKDNGTGGIIDDDDTNVGPGDGVDEPGPLR